MTVPQSTVARSRAASLARIADRLRLRRPAPRNFKRPIRCRSGCGRGTPTGCPTCRHRRSAGRPAGRCSRARPRHRLEFGLAAGAGPIWPLMMVRSSGGSLTAPPPLEQLLQGGRGGALDGIAGDVGDAARQRAQRVRHMLARGIGVTGSDAKDVPVLRALEAEGAAVWVGFHEGHQERADAVVDQLLHPRRQRRARRRAGARRARAAPRPGPGLADEAVGPVAVAGCQRQDDDDLDARRRAPPPRVPTRRSLPAARSPSSAPTRPSVAGDGFVVEADESDGSFLALPPRRRRRHQRAARPPRPLRQPRRRSRLPTRAFVATSGPAACSSPATTTPARARSPTGRGAGRRVLTYGYAADARPAGGEAHRGTPRRPSALDQDGVGARSARVPGHHNVLDASAAYLAAVGWAGQTRPSWRGSPGSAVRAGASSRAARPPASPSSTTTRTTRPRSRPWWGRPPHRRAAPGGPLRVSSSRTCTAARATSPASSPPALAPADQVVVLDVYGPARTHAGVSALVADPLRELPGRRSVRVGRHGRRRRRVVAAPHAPGTSCSPSGPATSPPARCPPRRPPGPARPAEPRRSTDQPWAPCAATSTARPRLSSASGQPLPRAGAVADRRRPWRRRPRSRLLPRPSSPRS